jgi:hypothetical protein
MNLLVGTKEDNKIHVSKDTQLRINPEAPKYEAQVPPIDQNVCISIYGVLIQSGMTTIKHCCTEHFPQHSLA